MLFLFLLHGNRWNRWRKSCFLIAWTVKRRHGVVTWRKQRTVEALHSPLLSVVAEHRSPSGATWYDDRRHKVDRRRRWAWVWCRRLSTEWGNGRNDTEAHANASPPRNSRCELCRRTPSTALPRRSRTPSPPSSCTERTIPPFLSLLFSLCVIPQAQLPILPQSPIIISRFSDLSGDFSPAKNSSNSNSSWTA